MKKEMSINFDDCDNHPTYNVFYSQKNVALILKRVADGTNSPGITAQFLYPYMRRVIDRFPGLYQVQFFKGKEEFTDQVLRHVQMMDDVLVQEISQEMAPGKGFFDYYYKLMTGNRPLVDRPEHHQKIGQSRKSDSIVLRDYSQWHLWGNK